MGKSNYIILILGVAACIGLSMIMQRVVRIKVDRDVPAVIGLITETFGSRLSQPPSFEVRTQGELRIGELILNPVVGQKPVRMVRMIGEFAWQEAGEDAALDVLVLTVDEGFGRPRRFEIARPFTELDPVRELKPGEEPGVSPRINKRAVVRAKPKATQATASQPVKVIPARPAGDKSENKTVPPKIPR